MRIKTLSPRQRQRPHENATPSGLAKRCKRDRQRSACRQLAKATVTR